MEANLQEQYELIEKVIGEYRSFIRKVLLIVFKPIDYIKIIIYFLKLSLDKKKNLSKDDIRILIIKRIAEIIYSESERNSPFYEIGIGPHSLHKLSCYIEKNHPCISYEHLLKMHEISDIKIKAGNPIKFFGFVLAAGSLFLKTVPQVVVESFNINYTNYQITTFWVWAVSLAYISILIAVWYTTGYKRNQVNKLAKEVVEYTAARVNTQSSNKSLQKSVKNGD